MDRRNFVVTCYDKLCNKIRKEYITKNFSEPTDEEIKEILERAREEIRSKYFSLNTGTQSIIMKKGGINNANIGDSAVVIIELPSGSREKSPQGEYIERDADLDRQTKVVETSSRNVLIRNSRISGKTYVFVKTETDDCIEDVMIVLKAELSQLELNGRKVYADRIRSDSNEILKNILFEVCEDVVYYYDTDDSTDNAVSHKAHYDFEPYELLNYLKKRIKGQDEAIKTGAMLIMDFLEKVPCKNYEYSAPNWLLTAPSGMGKTEFYRAVRDFFKERNVPIPVVQVDLSNITEAGFKGKNYDFIMESISNAAEGKCDGTAICFLDEADKKFAPSYDNKGINVNAAVQSNLLTLLEGIKTTVNDNEFDSGKTMFVLMGAFQNLRDRKQENALFLNSISPDNEPPVEDDLYGNITRDDMMQEGMLEEIAGRITAVVNLQRIKEDDMRLLISEKAANIGRENGYRIRLTQKGLNELMTIAYTPLGVRMPMNKIKSLMFSAVSEKYFTQGFERNDFDVVIDGLDRARLEKVRKKASYQCE